MSSNKINANGVFTMAFSIVPTIESFGSFSAFAQAYGLGEKDLVVTSQVIYDLHLKADLPHTDVLFLERYGSGEPSDRMIDALTADIRTRDYSRIVAVGGGTVIDVCKLLTLGGNWKAEALFERKVPLEKVRPLYVVPTTCGTGSEVTNVSIAELVDKNTKLGLAAPELFPDRAVLIPQLLVGLPHKVFATSSIDALVHAAESFVSPKASPYSQLFSQRAMEMILRGYRRVQAGEDLSPALMGDFLLASNYAGIAFGNAGCGAVHALSYPLGGTFHIPHGEANQLMFLPVFAKYREKRSDAVMGKLEEILAQSMDTERDEVWEKLDALLNRILARKPLREYGMKAEDFPVFADSVIEKQQRLLGNNYVFLSREDMLAIYHSAL